MNELRPKHKLTPYLIVTAVALLFALAIGYTTAGGAVFLAALPLLMLFGLVEWIMRLLRKSGRPGKPEI